MIVIERPSLDVGVHRRLLDKILRSSGIGHEEAWVTPVVKCEPPSGGKVAKKDLVECKAWLWLEMKLLRPRFVVAMGSTPASLLQRPAPAEGEPVDLGYLPGTRLVAWRSLSRIYRGPISEVYETVALFEDLRLEHSKDRILQAR